MLASGRYVALTSWLERLPPVEARSHPSLAQAAAELIPAELSTAGWPSPAENHTDDGPALPVAVPQRKRRQRSEHRAAGDEDPSVPLRVEARLFGNSSCS